MILERAALTSVDLDFFSFLVESTVKQQSTGPVRVQCLIVERWRSSNVVEAGMK
jgi:hypothetical protein